MKFKFPLEKVLGHRKQLETVAQREFLEAMSELNKQQDMLNSLVEELKGARHEAFRLQTTEAQSAEKLKQIYDFSKGQDLRIDRQKNRIKEQETLVENLREILRQRQQDYKIIERLKEKQSEEHKIAQRKLEQKKVDDIVIMRTLRGKN